MAKRLEGMLNPVTLASILEEVVERKAVAYLLASDGASEKCIFFSAGALRLTSVGKRKVLSVAAVAQNRLDLSDDELKRCIQLAESHRESLEDILVRRKHIGVKQARQLEAKIVKDELSDLVLWDNCYFEFQEGNPPPEVFDPRRHAVKLSFGGISILQKTAQNIDVWKRLKMKFLSLKSEVSLTEEGVAKRDAGGEMEELERNILEVMGEGAILENAIRELRKREIDSIEALQAIAKLVDEGLINLVPRAIPEEGWIPTSPEEIRVEVGEIEKALDHLISDLIARKKLARYYEELGDKKKAAMNHKRMGEKLMERGKMEEAIESYKSVLKLVPTDFEVHERVLKLLEKAKRFKEAVKQGLSLGKLYKRLGLLNRARNIYQYILKFKQKDMDLRQMLVDLQLKLGAKKDAIDQYEQMAEILEQQERFDEATRIYHEILRLDADHVFARKKLQVFLKKGRRFALRHAVLIGCFAVVLLIGPCIGYEYMAVLAFRSAKEKAVESLRAERFSEARSEIKQVLVSYDWSRITKRAQAFLDRIDMEEKEWKGEQLRNIYEKAKELENKGDVLGALALYKQVFGRASGLSKWETAGKESIERIEKYREEAEDLYREAYRLDKKGRSEKGFQVFQKLRRKFPWSEFLKKADLPLKVDSLPRGAQVFLNGERVGMTPLIVRFPMKECPVLELQKGGFVNEVLTLDRELEWPLHVDLKKKVLWRFHASGPIEAPPCVGEETVFVGSLDRMLYALNRDNGQLRWKCSMGIFGDIGSPPMRSGGSVIAASRNGRLVGLDPDTGAIRWEKKVETPVAMCAFEVGGICFVRAGKARKKLFAVDARTGKFRWTYEAPAPIPVEPALSRFGLLIGCENRTIYVVDAISGKKTDEYAIRSVPSSPPSVIGGFLLVGCTDGTLAIADLKKRKVARPFAADGAILSRPVASEGLVFVGSADGNLYALDMPDGFKRWAFKTKGPVRSAPTISEGMLYFSSDDGYLYALMPKTGSLRWRYHLGGEMVPAPRIVGGKIYAGSGSSRFFTITE
jgi:outer membrane protein assembly factor BamB/tetratricopeptide (TPR) repeat protein